MSPTTWTPDALRSERRAYAGEVHRCVEAQHRASTMAITDTLDEQTILEDLIERHKPSVPEAARGLHYLLFTPFRYRPAPRGSRFRRPGDPRGVFYAGESDRTALAERAFYALLAMAESIDDTPPRWRGQVTVFAVPVCTDAALDLTASPFDAHRESWIAPTDYTACQIVADTAREADCALIRYESARDPEGGCNIALFDPAGFARREPSALATWHLDADAHGVRAIADFRGDRLRFPREAFAHDPRLEPLRSF